MLGALLTRVVKDPGWSAWARGDDFSPGAETWSGAQVNDFTAMQLLTVFGCVSLIADTIATMPVHTYRKASGGGVVQLDTPMWLQQPDLETDLITFWTMVIVSLLLKGNAYVIVLRGSTGQIVELIPVHPNDVQIVRDPKSRRLVYIIQGAVFGGELLHIRGICWPGSPYGLSPLEAARQAIGAGLATQQFGARFFGQGSTMSGVITMPGAPPGDDTLKAIRESWTKSYGGSRNAHLPAFLYGGAQWTSMSITPEQGQFLQTRRFTSLEIASNLFRIPPDFVGLAIEGSSLTYQNIESRWSELIRRIQPWMVRLETGFSKLLPVPRYIKFSPDAYLRADTKTRYETYAIGLTNEFITVDEVRDLEDRPPLPPTTPPTGGQP